MKKIQIALPLALLTFLFAAKSTQAKLLEEDTLYPANSIMCSEFDLQYQSSQTSTDLNLPVGEARNLKEVAGEILIEQMDFPNFAGITANLQQALPKLLSQEENEQLNLEAPSLSNKLTNYVSGTDDSGSVTQATVNPETTADQPGWFTKILSQSWIACGLTGGCAGPKSLNIKVAKPAVYSPPPSVCAFGLNTTGEAVGNLVNDPTQFTIISWLKRTIQDIIDDISGIISGKKITDLATIKNQGSGMLAGGGSFNAQIADSYGAVWAEAKDLEGNGPVKNSSTYHVSDQFAIQGDDDLNWALGKGQKAFCLQQCALHDYGYDVSAEFDFCLSCNPDDYPLDPNFGSGVDDVPLDMSLCQWDPDIQGCHYYDPGGTQGCGPNQDAFCESGRCNPFEYGQAEDFLNNGCSLPYGDRGTNCNVASICQWAHFQKNPAGGFGACQYRNPDVCVRTDRIATGSCAAVCNNACCAWQ